MENEERRCCGLNIDVNTPPGAAATLEPVAELPQPAAAPDGDAHEG